MNTLRSERGHVMLFSLIITFILLMLGTTLLLALNSETMMNKEAELMAQAHYLAQAGIEHGLSLVESTPTGEEPAFPTGAVNVSTLDSKVLEYQIVKNGSEIQSTGRIKEDGNILKEVRIIATWDETGQVTVIR